MWKRKRNASRISIDDDCITNSHDECQWDNDNDRTDDNTDITKGYNEWDWEDDAMAETDSDITRGYNEKL